MSKQESRKELRNEDPITGEAGAHPIGTGLGAVVGSAAAGAAAGTVAGPVGTVAGAVVGGLAGGLAGKAVAENIDPTVELDYWRDEYRNRPYYSEEYGFEDYEPAYRAGIEAYTPGESMTWEEREELAASRYQGEHRALRWNDVRPAAKDAYDRLAQRRSASSTASTTSAPMRSNP